MDHTVNVIYKYIESSEMITGTLINNNSIALFSGACRIVMYMHSPDFSVTGIFFLSFFLFSFRVCGLFPLHVIRSAFRFHQGYVKKKEKKERNGRTHQKGKCI